MRLITVRDHVETIAPTPEQLAKGYYDPPKLDQKHARVAYRRTNGFERIRCLEPEHKQAWQKLEVHYYGAAGADVRWDDEHVAMDRQDVPDEFAQHRHAGLLENAKKAVGSPRVWQALVHQIHDTLSPQEIGHQWGGIKGRHQAKGYGEALIVAGLDSLCMHWGLVLKPG
jgi:hypothetical protein